MVYGMLGLARKKQTDELAAENMANGMSPDAAMKNAEATPPEELPVLSDAATQELVSAEMAKATQAGLGKGAGGALGNAAGTLGKGAAGALGNSAGALGNGLGSALGGADGLAGLAGGAAGGLFAGIEQGLDSAMGGIADGINKTLGGGSGSRSSGKSGKGSRSKSTIIFFINYDL